MTKTRIGLLAGLAFVAVLVCIVMRDYRRDRSTSGGSAVCWDLRKVFSSDHKLEYEYYDGRIGNTVVTIEPETPIHVGILALFQGASCIRMSDDEWSPVNPHDGVSRFRSIIRQQQAGRSLVLVLQAGGYVELTEIDGTTRTYRSTVDLQFVLRAFGIGHRSSDDEDK